MHPVLADLITLLRLERIEDNIFRGDSRDIGSPQVFGGQVLGQALSAAQHTVDDRVAHSLHAYFLRRGDINAPIIYDVDRARDGGSFSNRRVVAIQHGRPILNLAASFQNPEEGLNTTHFTVIDRDGNIVTYTNTIESGWGTGLMVPGWGFLLNNELTDFSREPTTDDGTPIANRVQPGKRPRSSMSPTIVLDDAGDVFLVTGSPGGSRIIAYTAQSIVNVIDFGLDPQEAINVPHYLDRNGAGGGSTDIEDPIPGVTLDYDAEALKATLEVDFDYVTPVDITGLTSGLSVIQIGDGVLIGGADQRRDGAVGGR